MYDYVLGITALHQRVRECPYRQPSFHSFIDRIPDDLVRAHILERAHVQATEDWCDDIHAAIVVMLRADDPSEDPEVADAAAGFLAPEFEHLAEELFTCVLSNLLEPDVQEN